MSVGCGREDFANLKARLAHTNTFDTEKSVTCIIHALFKI